jgi:acyl carrier protein
LTDDLRAETAEKIKSIISTFFNVPTEQVTEATVVDDIEGWDSTTHVGLILTVEDELGIEFSIERITAFANVGDLVDECVTLLKQKKSS